MTISLHHVSYKSDQYFFKDTSDRGTNSTENKTSLADFFLLQKLTYSFSIQRFANFSLN